MDSNNYSTQVEERYERPGVAGAEGLGRDPFAGDLFVFRGRAGSLIKALWHDGIGLWLYAKRLDRGRFVRPATLNGVVSLSAAQMSYLFGSDRLDKSATYLAAAECWIGIKDVLSRRKKSPHIADFVIPSASWNGFMC